MDIQNPDTCQLGTWVEDFSAWYICQRSGGGGVSHLKSGPASSGPVVLVHNPPRHFFPLPANVYREPNYNWALRKRKREGGGGEGHFCHPSILQLHVRSSTTKFSYCWSIRFNLGNGCVAVFRTKFEDLWIWCHLTAWPWHRSTCCWKSLQCTHYWQRLSGGWGVITKPASFSHTPSSSCWQLSMLPIPQFIVCVCASALCVCVCVGWNEWSACEMGSRPVTARWSLSEG